MPLANPATYVVEAYNLSHASENKIHDDSVAKKLGFTGGLVPGVEVYAYASHMPVQRFGRSWLERGTMDMRFLKPVYDGRIAEVHAIESADTLTLDVTSESVQCATGSAALAPAGVAAPHSADYTAATPPPMEHRPPASEASLAKGTVLGIRPVRLTEAVAAQYLADVRERAPIYATERLAHPGTLLRLCNTLLRENVVLAPWIHTGSKVRNFAVAEIGDELGARAVVSDNYERKGHRLVELDCLLLKNGDTPIAHVVHTAVYKLRHLG